MIFQDEMLILFLKRLSMIPYELAYNDHFVDADKRL